MDVAKAIADKFNRLRRKAKSDLSLSVEIKPTPGFLTAVGREALQNDFISGKVKPPQGWDDIKATLFIALNEKHGEMVRRCAIAQLAYLARQHRIGEVMLVNAYNEVGSEIRKHADDFPQFQPLLKTYETSSAEHNQKRAQLNVTVADFLRTDLEEILQ